MPTLPIADKTTLDAVNAKAGANTDVAGTTTIFARLKQIYDYLTGNLSAARVAKLDSLDAAISSRQANAGLTSTHVGRLDAAISSRAAATDIPVYVMPSDTVRIAANTERTATSHTIVKEILITKTGRYRVKFDIRISTSGYLCWVYLKKNNLSDDLNYVNTSSLSYVTKTLEVNLLAGDTLQVDLYSNGGGSTAYIRNIQLCYDPVSGSEVVLLN